MSWNHFLGSEGSGSWGQDCVQLIDSDSCPGLKRKSVWFFWPQVTLSCFHISFHKLLQFCRSRRGRWVSILTIHGGIIWPRVISSATCVDMSRTTRRHSTATCAFTPMKDLMNANIVEKDQNWNRIMRFTWKDCIWIKESHINVSHVAET